MQSPDIRESPSPWCAATWLGEGTGEKGVGGTGSALNTRPHHAAGSTIILIRDRPDTIHPELPISGPRVRLS